MSIHRTPAAAFSLSTDGLLKRGRIAAAAACLLLVACGDRGSDGAGAGKSQAAPAPAVAEPVASPPADAAPAVAPPPSTAAVARALATWFPVHEFLRGTVLGGQLIDDDNAVVFTDQNEVGTTRDGGRTWHFVRITGGEVRTVAGASTGPFLAAGAAGFMAISEDGQTWTNVPGATDQDIVAVATDGARVGAAAADGSFVTASREGAKLETALLPNGFKASSVVFKEGAIAVADGRNRMTSADGRTWAHGGAVVAPPPGMDGMTTREGRCSIDSREGSRVVVCAVRGTAYGVDEERAFVLGDRVLYSTSDRGRTWSVQPLPFAGARGMLVKPGGPHYIYGKGGQLAASEDGVRWELRPIGTKKDLTSAMYEGELVLVGVPHRHVFESGDGFRWRDVSIYQVVDRMPAPVPPRCSGIDLPDSGGACSQYRREVQSPADLPDVTGLFIREGVALAIGKSGLVMLSIDGGRGWSVHNGLARGRLRDFALRDHLIIALADRNLITSTDGGRRFEALDLQAQVGELMAAHIGAGGVGYLAGAGGSILRSRDLQRWSKLPVADSAERVSFRHLHEVGGAIYAAGSRGRLFRSDDQGDTWEDVATGIEEPIQGMVGEGEVVWAVTERISGSGGNRLLRSDDNGHHFALITEISSAGRVFDFALAGGRLRVDGLVSTDGAATWEPLREPYRLGALPLNGDANDPTTPRLAHVRAASGNDALYLLGTDPTDWLVVGGFSHRDAEFHCSLEAGCWMVAGGQVYRPGGAWPLAPLE